MRNSFVHRLSEIAETDSRVMLITGDLGFGVLTDYANRFPKQFLNVGVAEQNMTGIAAGMALEGRIVFTYSIGNFSTLRCLEQLRNDVCYHNASVIAVSVGGGFSYGALGFSHHATEDLAILRALPNLTVASPCDLWEAGEITRALVDRKGPGYLRLDKSAGKPSHAPGEKFEFGKMRCLREGSAATIIATGGILGVAQEAADVLANKGISCRLLACHSLRPFDDAAVLAAATQTAGIITLEEHTVDGGLGGHVAETLLEQGAYPGWFYRLGLRKGFSTVVGSQSYLRSVYGMDSESLVRLIEMKQPLSTASSDMGRQLDAFLPSSSQQS